MNTLSWKLLFALYATAAVAVHAHGDDGDDDDDMASMSMSMSMDMDSSSSSITAECNSTVSASEIATVTDGDYYSTCVNGTTYNITTVFDVLNLTSTDLLTWCESEACLTPLHELLDTMPEDCLVDYEGTETNLYEQVSAVHAECHAVKHAAAEASSSGRSSGSAGSTVGSSTSASAPTGALSVALSVAAVAASYVLA